MKVMSFNLLCGGKEGRDWKVRKEMVIDTIRREMPDTLGVQEAHYNWIKTLLKAMPEYDFVGVGRGDGKKDGEFSAVFYKKDKFILLDSGTFWLSETPEIPSMGWDSAHPRVCSFAKLKCKDSGLTFVHFNTHLDHRGEVAKRKGADLLVEKAQEIGGRLPILLTGDFNVVPDTMPYKTIIEGGFEDARMVAMKTDRGVTFHADVFVTDTPRVQESIIDYCFKKGSVTVKAYRVIREVYPGKLYPSDHYPIVVDVEING